jgi:hypothetical protein
MQIALIQKQQYANAGMPPLLVLVKDMMRYFLLSFSVGFPPVKQKFYCAFRRKRKIGTNDTEMKREGCFLACKAPASQKFRAFFCDGVLRRKEKKKYRVRPNSVPDGLPQNNV